MLAMFDEIALSRVRWATRALVLMSNEAEHGLVPYCPSGLTVVRPGAAQFADGGPQQAELVRQDADGQVVFLLVLDHFVDLVFHADVDAVVAEDAFVGVFHLVEGGEVAVDVADRVSWRYASCCRTGRSRKSAWCWRGLAGFDGLAELFLEQLGREVAGRVARRVEVRDVAGQYAMTCFREVDDLLQERNARWCRIMWRACFDPRLLAPLKYLTLTYPSFLIAVRTGECNWCAVAGA